MLFSSTVFIFLFLPLVFLIYLLVGKELKNYILLIASIVFYAWGEPRYLAIMLLTIIINYLGALALEHFKRAKTPLLVFTIALNLSFLIYFKYFNFIVSNLNSCLGSDFNFVHVIMPIGISFYTFQAMSYLIDVYRGDTEVQRDIYKLALYISLFPQLIAGPIVKYKDIEQQIDSRCTSFDQVGYGIKRFIIGLSKKVLIANTLGEIVDRIHAQSIEQIDTWTTWVGAIFYSLQLYFDFSGYSDMAIGLGAIFGFKFLENFNYPYISKSITEFWRRWHISLSTWFKQYLYIPLGGNRVKPSRLYINLFIVFLATGLWHGAEWTFIVWGLWHGFFIILEKFTGWNKPQAHPVLRVTQHLYTILVFVIGWVIFRSQDMDYAITYIGKMFGLHGSSNVFIKVDYILTDMSAITCIIGVILSIPIFKQMLEIQNQSIYRRAGINIWLITIFVMSISAIAASTYNPFIYFRF